MRMKVQDEIASKDLFPKESPESLVELSLVVSRIGYFNEGIIREGVYETDYTVPEVRRRRHEMKLIST